MTKPSLGYFLKPLKGLAAGRDYPRRGLSLGFYQGESAPERPRLDPYPDLISSGPKTT